MNSLNKPKIKIGEITQSLNFHPVLKEIEKFFIFNIMLFNKAISLPETQDILKSDSVFNEIINDFNKDYNLTIEKDNQGKYVTKMNVKKQMIFLGKITSILMSDYLTDSVYNSKIDKKNEMIFLRQIRNGAAHNNKFVFKKGFIKKGKSVTWNNKKIDLSLQNKVVFDEFINVFEIMILGNEISQILFEIDKTSKPISQTTLPSHQKLEKKN